LLVLACSGETAAGHALREIGVEIDALWGTLERIRRQRTEEREALIRTVTEVREKKEHALESKQFDQAAQLRDQERELTDQARPSTAIGEDVLEEIRRRLGLPNPEK
jgi:hypothetical protein